VKKGFESGKLPPANATCGRGGQGSGTHKKPTHLFFERSEQTDFRP
jgi:hypothetical protein